MLQRAKPVAPRGPCLPAQRPAVRCALAHVRPGRTLLSVRATLEPPADPRATTGSSAFTSGPASSPTGPLSGTPITPVPPARASSGPTLGSGPGFPPIGGSGPGGSGGSGGHGRSSGGPEGPGGWTLGRLAWLALGLTLGYAVFKAFTTNVTTETTAAKTAELKADVKEAKAEAKDKGRSIVGAIKHKAEEVAHDAHIAAVKTEKNVERAKDKVEHGVERAVDSAKHGLELAGEKTRHRASEAAKDVRHAKDTAKHAVESTAKDVKYGVKDTAKDAKHAAELKGKDIKHGAHEAGREAEYAGRSAAKGTLETVKDAAHSVGSALRWTGSKAEDATRKGVNKVEKGAGVYSAPTTTTDRTVLYRSLIGAGVGGGVLLGLWVWDRSGRPGGGDVAKKAREGLNKASDTIKDAASKATGTDPTRPQ